MGRPITCSGRAASGAPLKADAGGRSDRPGQGGQGRAESARGVPAVLAPGLVGSPAAFTAVTRYENSPTAAGLAGSPPAHAVDACCRMQSNVLLSPTHVGHPSPWRTHDHDR